MLSFKQFINEDADIDIKLKKLGLKRTNKFGGIGKEIGGEIYLHKQYEHTLPQNLLNKAKSFLPKDYEYHVVKFNPKTNVFSFIQSNDFDTNEEPSVDAVMTVKPDGTVKKQGNSGWIYHHKWQWVADDYKGFDVQKSKERSLKWSSLEGVDKSRIGQRKHWDDNVIPRLTEDITNIVKNEDGSPLILYRGQPKNYHQGDLLERYYTTDKKYAETYKSQSEEDDEDSVIAINLKSNKIFFGEQNYVTDWEFWDDRDNLIAQGYDTIASKDKKTWYPFDTTKKSDEVNKNKSSNETKNRIIVL